MKHDDDLKKPLFWYIKKLSFLRMRVFWDFLMVPEGGLEPPHLSAYAPQAYMSTIPSPGQKIYGAPSRVRTYNQRFRRPLLFQLSYGCMFLIWISRRIIEKYVKKANFFYIFTVFLLPNPYFSLYWRLCKQSMSKSVPVDPVASDRAHTSKLDSMQIENSMATETMR